MFPLLLLATVSSAGQSQEERSARIAGARAVVTAIVQAAEANRKQPLPLRGDELTQHYVRAAARTALTLDVSQRGQAFLLGIGVALDPSSLIRNNLLVASTWRQIESDAERRTRLAVLGEPQTHGRQDLTQHFAVSAALTVALGEKGAESAGLLKETLDAREGGSGFSFADLGANYAGISLAKRVLADPGKRLAQLEKTFRPGDFVPSPRGLIEGLTSKQFESRFGGLSDARFRKAREQLLQQIATLPGHQD